ncbi:hypothetical protein [Tahibacter amnicola]|uniref:Uncharacterized protein n=1 Tax=Tahibacter amnicola TaxID=2976241 RepID=A0ABY6BIP7_9GAMM|nr:hypothetical protein [Tahibacter amnicola]UXI69466.1 hypothetical protein N4264_07400 [Tahibacter amnicola]
MSQDVPPFLYLTEVDDAAPLVGAVFERKFGHAFPEWKHHLIAFYRRDDGALVPLSYVKFFFLGSVMLVGGAFTDGRGFAAMSQEQRDAVTASGGVMVHLLRYGFRHFADRCDAYFGYCGDARAWEVDLAAGFEPVGPERLLAHWHKPLHANTRKAYIAMAEALGAF